MDQVRRFAVSTDQAESFDHWREAWMAPMFRADVTAPDPSLYRSRLRGLQLAQLAVIESRCTPSTLHRTEGLARDGDDGLIVGLPWSSPLGFRAGDDEGQVEAGAGLILPMNEANTLMAPGGMYGASIRVDREAIRGSFPGAEQALRRPLPLASTAARLLRAYIVSLVAAGDDLPQPMAQTAEAHILELLAHAFDPSGDLARAAPHGGLRAARMQAVLDEIALCLEDPNLSATTVGRRLNLSERYVQQLMEGAGMSFSAFVRQRRLDKARTLLRNPATSHLRIVDIAGLTGFGDLSHFNREFRRRFGETPRDLRRARA